MNVDELMVKDSEFEKAGSIISQYANLLNQAISEYHKTLVQISSNSIKSGQVHDALEVYIGYVADLNGKMEIVGNKFKRMTDTYINCIDKADRYLYEKGGTVVRDFSSDEVAKLYKLLDDPWCSITDGFGDWIRGKLIKWFNADDVTSSKADIDACHKHLLDYNDATKRTIDHIVNDVYNVDLKYGRSIAGATPFDGDFYTSNFANSALVFYSVRDILNKMASIVEPNKGRFTVENIRNSLEDLFKELNKYYYQTVSVVCDDADITIEVIEKFASEYWAISFFHPFTGVISMFLADIGGREAAMMVVFNMFDIAEGQIISQGEYEKMVIKEELMAILDDMANSYVYEGSDEQAIIDDCSDFLKYVKKYGDKWYEYMNTHRGTNGKLLLDGRTKEAKAFKKMLDGLGGAKEILKYGDDALDVIAKIFTDYSKNLEILDSFINNQFGDDNMSACAAEIKKLYEKELSGILAEAGQKIKEVGFDAAMSWLGGELPPVKVVQTIKKVIGTVGEVTGLGDKAKNMYNAMIYQDMYYSSESAYESALKKVQEAIKNGKNVGKEYQKLINDLKNCFNMTRNTAVKMFTAMAQASDGTKKSYYEYCASRAESATMAYDSVNPGKFDILSYEEYINY